MPPFISCSTRSPYFLGATFEASLLRVSRRLRCCATSTWLVQGVSAISRISAASKSARSSRARAYMIEYRWAEGSHDRAAELAAEFVRRKVDVIVTGGLPAVAVKQATSVIPIVFAVASDRSSLVRDRKSVV